MKQLSNKDALFVRKAINTHWKNFENQGILNSVYIERLLRSWRAEIGYETRKYKRDRRNKHQILISKGLIAALLKKHRWFLKRESY